MTRLDYDRLCNVNDKSQDITSHGYASRRIIETMRRYWDYVSIERHRWWFNHELLNTQCNKSRAIHLEIFRHCIFYLYQFFLSSLFPSYIFYIRVFFFLYFFHYICLIRKKYKWIKQIHSFLKKYRRKPNMIKKVYLIFKYDSWDYFRNTFATRVIRQKNILNALTQSIWNVFSFRISRLPS